MSIEAESVCGIFVFVPAFTLRNYSPARGPRVCTRDSFM